MRKIALALAFILGLANGALAQAPAPIPALPDSPRITTYGINSSTCACSVGFAIYGQSGTPVDAWIQVYVNGTAYLSTDPTFGWSLSSVSGPLNSIARPITNAVLTFNSTQTGTVVIVGDRRPSRTSQFSENRGVPARDLNQAVTDLQATQRELWDKSNRSIVGQPGEVLLPLPNAAARAGQNLIFDANGQPSLGAFVPVPPALLTGANTWLGLNTFTAGIASIPGVPGSVNNNPGQYNCFIGSTIYCGNTTAISSVAPGFTSAGVSGITIGAPSGAAAAIFGAQCSLGTGVGYLACGPAVQCYIYADTTQTDNNGISCGYSAAVLLATSDPVAVGGGRAYGYVGHEFSVVNDWGYVATDPYNYNGNGTVHGMRVDCGIGLGGHNNCGGSAYEVVSNTEQYGGGLLCGQGSLVTSTLFGFSGLGRCAAMADSQGLFWYSAAGTLAAGIFEQINSTPFLHLSVPTNGALEFDVNGAAIMGWNVGTFFPNTTNAVALGGSSLRWSNIFSVLGNFTGTVTVPNILAATIYSAAGTALPSCASGTNGMSAVVSDATGATYAGAYTSGGAQTRRVLCVNGTGWITN